MIGIARYRKGDEQAMNSTTGRCCSAARRNEKLATVTYDETCAFLARERQPELDGLKKDEAAPPSWGLRRNKAFCSRDAEV